MCAGTPVFFNLLINLLEQFKECLGAGSLHSIQVPDNTENAFSVGVVICTLFAYIDYI